MRKQKANTGIWKYLAERNLLDTDEATIKAAKKEYRKLYLNQYKKRKRELKLEHVVALSPQEKSVISKKAKEHSMTVSLFLRKSTMAYIDRHIIFPKQYHIVELKKLMLTIIETLDQLNNKDSGLLSRTRNYDLLKEKVEWIYLNSIPMLTQSRYLEEIMIEELQSNPSVSTSIEKILNRYAHQITKP